MMKLHCVAIGRTSETYVQEAVNIYAKRIARYCDFSLRELEIPRAWKKLPKNELIQREGLLLLDALASYQTVILLDQRGESLSSEVFASRIEKHLTYGPPSLALTIGGPYGFNNSIREQFPAWISLSSMTLSHQLVRIVLLEQIYRAFSIIRGEPYHHA